MPVVYDNNLERVTITETPNGYSASSGLFKIEVGGTQNIHSLTYETLEAIGNAIAAVIARKKTRHIDPL